MGAILAGRDDYAAALADLGFCDEGFSKALRAGSSGHRLDEFSDNARIIKAAMCEGDGPGLLCERSARRSFPKTHLRKLGCKDMLARLSIKARLLP